jgi:hypothetical protein
MDRVIHYHGTPITPRAHLLRMAGRHFCVSFARDQDLKTCLRIGQSVMLDNGAFSIWRKGGKLDVSAYYRWLEPVLTPPHWAVIPDMIDGTVDQQRQMRATWPRETFGYASCAPVWHLHLPLEELLYLVDAYPKVCLGSSGQWSTPGTPAWCARMDAIFNTLARRPGPMPWLHGLRMLGQTDGGWPFASGDSTNVAQNFKPGCAECKANLIDAQQPALHWKPRDEQLELGV